MQRITDPLKRILRRSTFGDGLNGLLVRLGGALVEADEVDLVELGVGAEELIDLVGGDGGGSIDGEAVGAGADGGEGDGFDVVAKGDREAVAVAVGEELVFAVITPLPDGAYGVDDVSGGEVVALGEAGFACGAAADFFCILRGVWGRRRGGWRRLRLRRRGGIRWRR